MPDAALFAYGAALAIAVATPGPAMIAVIATGAARGTREALLLAAGVALGDVVLAGLALLGLAAVAAAFGWMFRLIKYAGAAYLVWIGISMWQSPPRPAGLTSTAPGLRSLALGFVVAIGNPKAILFHLSLMPLILGVSALAWTKAPLLAGIVLVVNLAIMSAYAVLGGHSARWLASGGRMRWANRIGGSAMIGTGAAIAVR